MVLNALLAGIHIPRNHFSPNSNLEKYYNACVLSRSSICFASSSSFSAMSLNRLSSSRASSALALALINLRSKSERYSNFALFSSLVSCPSSTAFLFPSLTYGGPSIPSSPAVEAEAPAEISEELNIEGPATGAPGMVLKRAARAARACRSPSEIGIGDFDIWSFLKGGSACVPDLYC